MKSRLLILLVLLAICLNVNGTKPCEAVPGVWICVDKWLKPPKEITSTTEYGLAVVLRFCSDGAFHMTRAYLYVQGKTANLGVSDGREEYTGKWYVRNGKVEVTYKLTDYEIAFPGYKEAESYEASAVPECEEGYMFFDVLLIRDGYQYFRRKFQPLNAFPFSLSDDLACPK